MNYGHFYEFIATNGTCEGHDLFFETVLDLLVTLQAFKPPRRL